MSIRNNAFRFMHMLRNISRFFISYHMDLPWKVGDTVVDHLTHTLVKVQGIEWANGQVKDAKGRATNYGGCTAVWVSDKYLDGGRHPWEVSKPLTTEEISKWEADLKKYQTKNQGG